MADITVTSEGDDVYRVVVSEGGGTTDHQVTSPSGDVARLAPGASAEAVVEASFRFLLDREPKESILSRFDLAVIGRYFREYPERIGEYLRS